MHCGHPTRVRSRSRTHHIHITHTHPRATHTHRNTHAGFGDENDAVDAAAAALRRASITSDASEIDLDDLGFGITPGEQAKLDNDHDKVFSKDMAFANQLDGDDLDNEESAIEAEQREALQALLVGRQTDLSSTLERIDPTLLRFDAPAGPGGGKKGGKKGGPKAGLAVPAGNASKKGGSSPGVSKKKGGGAQAAAPVPSQPVALPPGQSAVAAQVSAGERKLQQRARRRAELIKSANRQGPSEKYVARPVASAGAVVGRGGGKGGYVAWNGTPLVRCEAAVVAAIGRHQLRACGSRSARCTP